MTMTIASAFLLLCPNEEGIGKGVRPKVLRRRMYLRQLDQYPPPRVTGFGFPYKRNPIPGSSI
jgi:hypothetical protein